MFNELKKYIKVSYFEEIFPYILTFIMGIVIYIYSPFFFIALLPLFIGYLLFTFIYLNILSLILLNFKKRYLTVIILTTIFSLTATIIKIYDIIVQKHNFELILNYFDIDHAFFIYILPSLFIVAIIISSINKIIKKQNYGQFIRYSLLSISVFFIQIFLLFKIIPYVMFSETDNCLFREYNQHNITTQCAIERSIKENNKNICFNSQHPNECLLSYIIATKKFDLCEEVSSYVAKNECFDMATRYGGK